MSAPDRMDQAQLYWDDQDPRSAGWWLRYVDARGVDQGCEVDEAEDATTRELAAAVEAAIGVDSTLTGTVEVLRGDAPRGSIRLSRGTATDWRAL